MSTAPDRSNEQVWRMIFAEGHPKLKSYQRLHNWLPAPPRCKLCFAPFGGVGGAIMRLRGKGPNRRNPQYCDACDKFINAYPGGTEVELSLIFVDVRGSVSIAEHMPPTEFSRMMNSFYASTSAVLANTDGFVIDAAGDHVVGVYPPGFCGPEHARKVVEAAAHLVHGTGPRGLDGLPIPIGIGIHTGNVFIGTVTAADGQVQDVTVLGDNANIAARLAEMAGSGEALVSAEACAASGLRVEDIEHRQLMLKGKSVPIDVRVIRRNVQRETPN